MPVLNLIFIFKGKARVKLHTKLQLNTMNVWKLFLLRDDGITGGVNLQLSLVQVRNYNQHRNELTSPVICLYTTPEEIP